MRILMITDFYWPFLGGVEQHVRHLSAALVARGHDVAVVTQWSEGLAKEEHDGQVRVYRVRSSMSRLSWLFSHPQRPWAAPFPDPAVTRALRQIVAREQPDVVHGHDWLARSFLPLKTRNGAKFVASLHYYTQSCAKKNLMYRDAPCSGPGFTKCLRCSTAHYGAAKGVPVTLGNWGMSAAERATVDMFLPVSHATAEGNGLVGSRLPFTVVPNFLPDELGAAQDDLDTYMAQLPSDEFLLFVGDLRRLKGLDVLLDAYAKLSNVPPLVLIGKVWAETPAQFPPNVVVLKNWPNYAVLAAWRRSLAAVVPSIWPEPFGIVVIEAMASGRPVIASRIGGITDLVVDGETGLLVPPGDSGALSHAIEQIVRDSVMRERMGQAAQQRAAEFRVSAVVPRIEQVYNQVTRRQAAVGSEQDLAA